MNFVLQQGLIFLLMTLTGFIIGICYKLYHFFTIKIKFNKLVQFIGDIIFWILLIIMVFGVLLLFNNGEVRAFFFIALVTGFLSCVLLIKTNDNK